MEHMQQQMQDFVQYVQQEVWNRARAAMPKDDAIIPMRKPVVIPPRKR
jgi:hypothetical protein